MIHSIIPIEIIFGNEFGYEYGQYDPYGPYLPVDPSVMPYPSEPGATHPSRRHPFSDPGGFGILKTQATMGFRDIQYAGETVQVQDLGNGKAKIHRIISTNPRSYLRKNIQPGKVISLHGNLS